MRAHTYNITMTFQRWFTAACLCCALGIGTANAAPNDDGYAAYRNGDYAQAIKILRPLAAKGDADAQFYLGGMYFFGQGVIKNRLEALKWLRLAAAQGDFRAQGTLGAMYQEGKDVPQNNQEALKWYRLAAAQGDADAQQNLRHPEMVEAAQKLAIASPIGGTVIRYVPKKSLLAAQGRITDYGYIEISGDIRKSAGPILLAHIDQTRKADISTLVFLNSRGGEIQAAMQMGQILRSQAAEVFVDANAECSSACILVLAGGVSRVAFRGAKLGIHRPSFQPEEFAELSHAQSQDRYGALSVAVKQYLSHMGMADGLYDAMMKVPSRKMEYLSEKFAEASGLIGDDPAYEEWKRSKRLKAWGPERLQELEQHMDCLNAGRPERECSH